MNELIKQFDALPTRIGLGSFSQPTDERLRFIKQIGVDHILMNFYRTPLIDTAHAEQPLHGDGEWSFNELVSLRNRIEDYGLKLNAIENLPKEFYRDIMLGKPNRDRQIEKVQRTLENIARAGVPIFGYDWDPTDVLRSSTTYPLRGGAQSMAINLDDFKNAPLLLDREYSETEMWECYHYFLEHIIPVLEQTGLKWLFIQQTLQSQELAAFRGFSVRVKRLTRLLISCRARIMAANFAWVTGRLWVKTLRM